MSRILARSLVADLLARLLNAVLFILLAPFILLAALGVPKGHAQAMPFSISLPRDGLTEPS